MDVPVLAGRSTGSLLRGHAVGLSVGEGDTEFL